MEEFLLHLPASPLGWIGLFFSGVVATLLFMNKVRSQDLTVLRDSNQDLRSALDDNVKKLVELEGKIEILTAEVRILEGKNRTLQELVANALKEYFVENPKIAVKLNRELLK